MLDSVRINRTTMSDTPNNSESDLPPPEQNRINPPVKNVPIKINMGAGPGIVQILFDPPAVRLSFDPKSARDFAIAILNNCQIAELPPPPLIQQFEPGPIIPAR